MQLDLDSFIPPALYAAVAEILVWAYQIDASSQGLHTVNIDQDNINDTDINSGI
jgi:flagellar biosynthesis protein FlhB